MRNIENMGVISYKKVVVLVVCAVVACLLLILAGCAGGSETGFSSEEDNTQQTASGWDASIDCASCHMAEATSQTSESYRHIEHSGMNCLSCHVDNDDLEKAHIDAGTDVSKAKLKKTEIDENICLSCHTKADLATATANNTVLTDKEGLTVNPHDLPEKEDHKKVNCISCHVMHTDKNIDEEAQASCISCHHENVYECYTCH